MGALETEVLRCLCRHDGGLTPREAQAALGGELAYTTVGTILIRLERKGLATREAAGRGYRYRAALSPDEVAARRMHIALRTADDRKEVLAHFVGDLTVREAAALRRLLGEDG